METKKEVRHKIHSKHEGIKNVTAFSSHVGIFKTRHGCYKTKKMSWISSAVCQFELKPNDYPMKTNRCTWWHRITVQGHRRNITL